MLMVIMDSCLNSVFSCSNLKRKLFSKCDEGAMIVSLQQLHCIETTKKLSKYGLRVLLACIHSLTKWKSSMHKRIKEHDSLSAFVCL